MKPIEQLYQFTQQLFAETTVQKAWAVVLRHIADSCHADAAAYVQTSPRHHMNALTQQITDMQWLEVINRSLTDTATHQLQLATISPALSHVLIMPMSQPGHTAWLLIGREENAITEEEIPHLAMMRDYGITYAQRLNNAAIFTALQKFGTLVSESNNLGSILDGALNSIRELVPYEAGEITIYDSDEALMVRSAHHFNRNSVPFDEPDIAHYRRNEGLSGWLSTTQQPLLIDDMTMVDSIKPKSYAMQSWIHGYVGLPLLSRGEFIGTMELATGSSGGFSSEDQYTLSLFAAPLAGAIYTYQLKQQSDVQKSALIQWQSFARFGRAFDDPVNFFPTLLTHMQEVLNVDIAGLLLYTEQQTALQAHASFKGIPEWWVKRYVVSGDASRNSEIFNANSPYWVSMDCQHEPEITDLGLNDLAQAVQMGAAMYVPLTVQNNPIGFLQIANPIDRQGFTLQDIAMLQALAEHITGLVYAALTLERMQWRTAQLESLVDVATTLGATLELETVLTEIVRTVSRLFDCQSAALFGLDATANELQLIAAEGAAEHFRTNVHSISVTAGGRGHAIAVNELTYVSDTERESDDNLIAPVVETDGMRAFIDVPLQRGDRAVGLLSVQFTDPHYFDHSELNLLRILAEQAAVAMENAQLYTQTDVELQQQLRAMHALQHVTREITATVELDHILNVVLSEAIHAGEADAGFIITFDGPDTHLRVHNGYDEESIAKLQEMFGAARASVPTPMMTLFMEEQTIQHINNVQTSEFPEARTLLLVPVFYAEMLSAAILIQTRRSSAFPASVVDFVEGLAIQTAIAIGNAQRFQDQVVRGELMHQRAEQMSLLLEVSRTMRSERALEDVLLDVAYAVQEGSGFDIVLISVLEGDNLRRVAGAGIPIYEFEQLKDVNLPWDQVSALRQERFQIGQCYYIPDTYKDLHAQLAIYASDGRYSGQGRGSWHADDLFFVPLRGANDEVVGIMSVDQPRDGRAPTAMTAEVIEIFASQVALAIENNRLVENLRRQVSTLQLFNELSRSIATKLDLPLVLNTVVQSVTNMLDYDYSTIFLADDDGSTFQPMASSGFTVELLDEKVYSGEDNLVNAVAKRGMPLVIHDAVNDARFISGVIDIGSSVMVPLVVEGRSVGVLTADRKESGVFSPADVATLTALADQVSLAVDNARLFDRVTRFNEELELRVAERTQELAEALDSFRVQRDRSEVLYHIASELVASLDMDSVLSQALSILQRAVKASRSSAVLLDNDTGELLIRAAIGDDENIPMGGRKAPYRRDEGVVGWVLKKRKSVIIADTQEDERCELDVKAGMRSVLAVPVLGSAGEALGALILQSVTPDVFDEIQLQLVEAAAVQLSNALNNAELYRLIREQAERLGVMLRTQQIESTKNEAILEGIADGVMVANAEGRVTLFNAAAERILAVTRSQALGRFLDDMLGLYGGEAREWLSRIDDWKNNPREYAGDAFLAQRLEVGRKYVSVHLSPVVSAGREFLGVVSVFRDITAEIEADRAKSDFVSTVSHELRTPMTSIVGYVDLMLKGAVGQLTDMQQGFLQKVKINADRLTDLVNDLLDISRIEQGRIELQVEDVAIEDLIMQVVDLVRPKVDEKGQTLNVYLPDSLPPIHGDSVRVRQILTNLVGNAYKYTPNDGTISVYAYVRDEMMMVSVADDGIGIAPENQQKIFERFYRVEDDPAVYEVSGTGLGLAITLSLIQMHGGTISLESELGTGSIFTFTMPLAPNAATTDVGDLPPSVITVAPRSILVVEDDREVANMLKMTFESEGLNVLVANNGEDALRTARDKLPDMISLDIRLPDLDGTEVLKLLKREPNTADIPVVVVSVVADRERMINLGAADYITKPVDEERLHNVFGRLLDQQDLIVIASRYRETLDTLRPIFQTQGFGVRTTTHGERALQFAKERLPAAIILDDELVDYNGYEILRQLRRSSRTRTVPVCLIVQANEFDDSILNMYTPVRIASRPVSTEKVVTDILEMIQDVSQEEE